MSNSPKFTRIEAYEQFDTFEGMVRDRHHNAHVVVKVPHVIKDKHGILAAPGLADGTAGLDRLTNSFAEEGRVSYSLDHPRTDDDNYSDDPEGHKSSTLHLVTSSVTKRFKLKKDVDVAAHSEALGNTTRFALKHPELVRTITGLGGGGLIEGDTLVTVARRSFHNLPHMGREVLPRLFRHPTHNLQMFGSCVGYVASNPTKVIGEALAISSHDIRYRFPLLHDVGIGTHEVQFGGDEFFPLDLVNQSTDYGSIFNLYTVYPYDLNAGHLTPQFHPRHVGKVVLDGIDTLINSGFVGGKSKVPFNDTPEDLPVAKPTAKLRLVS